MDLPKAAYDKWVRDALLISYRDETFVIAVSNAYSRDWLESRLTSKIRRLLAGICNTRVEVRFVSINDMG